MELYVLVRVEVRVPVYSNSYLPIMWVLSAFRHTGHGTKIIEPLILLLGKHHLRACSTHRSRVLRTLLGTCVAPVWFPITDVTTCGTHLRVPRGQATKDGFAPGGLEGVQLLVVDAVLLADVLARVHGRAALVPGHARAASVAPAPTSPPGHPRRCITLVVGVIRDHVRGQVDL